MSIDLGIDMPIVFYPSLVVFIKHDFLINTFNAAKTRKYMNGALMKDLPCSSLFGSSL